MPGLRLGTIFADLGAHLDTLAERQRQLLLLRLGRFIGTDYPLHKRVTHHIGILKVAEADALYPLQDIDRVQQARAPWIAGQGQGNIRIRGWKHPIGARYLSS